MSHTLCIKRSLSPCWLIGLLSSDVIDLSDESGVVKNIHKFPADYGTGYFTDRETLILLKVESRLSFILQCVNCNV